MASSALQSKPCGRDAIEFVASFDDKYQLAALVKAAALGQRSPEDIAKAFQNSRYTSSRFIAAGLSALAALSGTRSIAPSMPGKGGIFAVRVGGEVVAARSKGHFPGATEIVKAAAAAVKAGSHHS